MGWRVRKYSFLIVIFAIMALFIYVYVSSSDIRPEDIVMGYDFSSTMDRAYIMTSTESQKEAELASENDNTSSVPNVVLSADVEKIINMSTEEVFLLISEGKYKSYDEANRDFLNNFSASQAFWTQFLVYVEVPTWAWENKGDYTSKVTVNRKIYVNKYLAEYFSSFMTDLYNLPEKYVIKDLGGFSFRAKNNDSGRYDISGHSFGATLDINSTTYGMGSYPASKYSPAGLPFKTRKGLSEPFASECCTQDSDWFQLALKYGLDWGGSWTKDSLDPMHFSLVGDNDREAPWRGKIRAEGQSSK